MLLDAAKRGVFKSFLPLTTHATSMDTSHVNGLFTKQQRQEVFALRDFHAYEMLVGPVMATSPRAAMRRCILLTTECQSDIDADYESEASSDDEEEPETLDPNASVGEKDIYCECCEMWLNGPSQYDDHKIGKRHKKKLRR